MKEIKCPNCGFKQKHSLYTKIDLKQNARNEAIFFCTLVMYKHMNPNTKMDIPSMAYETIEKKYDKWKELTE